MKLTLASGELLFIDRSEIVALSHTLGAGDAWIHLRGNPAGFLVQAHQEAVTALYKDLTHGEALPAGW